jgi:hypothetical protein
MIHRPGSRPGSDKSHVSLRPRREVVTDDSTDEVLRVLEDIRHHAHRPNDREGGPGQRREPPRIGDDRFVAEGIDAHHQTLTARCGAS